MKKKRKEKKKEEEYIPVEKKRSIKEINKKIAELVEHCEKANGIFGGGRAGEFADVLEQCKDMEYDEIMGKIEDVIETDYELYAVYDWVVNGRDDFSC